MSYEIIKIPIINVIYHSCIWYCFSVSVFRFLYFKHLKYNSDLLLDSHFYSRRESTSNKMTYSLFYKLLSP